ncbi:hypothetical protein QP157_21115 [Sphingomonas sp. LR61]
MKGREIASASRFLTCGQERAGRRRRSGNEHGEGQQRAAPTEPVGQQAADETAQKDARGDPGRNCSHPRSAVGGIEVLADHGARLGSDRGQRADHDEAPDQNAWARCGGSESQNAGKRQQLNRYEGAGADAVGEWGYEGEAEQVAGHRRRRDDCDQRQWCAEVAGDVGECRLHRGVVGDGPTGGDREYRDGGP